MQVDDNWQVKVADFGLATVKSRTFAKTMCGTTGWVAPEVLAEQGYTEKADVYSFAIILWEILTRQIPYAGLFLFLSLTPLSLFPLILVFLHPSFSYCYCYICIYW